MNNKEGFLLPFYVNIVEPSGFFFIINSDFTRRYREKNLVLFCLLKMILGLNIIIFDKTNNNIGIHR